MIAYIKHGKWGGPYLTERADGVRQSPAPFSGRIASGYGSRIPSGYEVKTRGRWHRVYVTCFSNSGTSWINLGGARVIVDVDHE